MIEQYSFGNMIIDGQKYRRDLKIIHGRMREEWWRKDPMWRGHFI
jgi:hypothetical protein